jgi:hypothetical protein
MGYYFRSGSLLEFFPWLFVFFAFSIGGWFLSSNVFKLERKERLIVGSFVGLVLYLFVLNLTGQLFSVEIANVISPLLVLLLGILSYRKFRIAPDFSELSDNRKMLVVFVIFLFIFYRIHQGLTLFDEHKNLSLISTMANGDIPPHFYMNISKNFPYHYGFQLFCSGLVKIGGMFPWVAYDFGKAIATTYLIFMVYFVGARYQKIFIQRIIFAVFVFFAMGTRYLLFFLPRSFIAQADQQITFLGAASDLYGSFSESLVSSWFYSGSNSFSVPFAFLNGISGWPRVLTAGPGNLSGALFFLIWLLFSKTKDRYSFTLFGITLSIWALVSESSYVLFLSGMILLALFLWIKKLRGGGLPSPQLAAGIYGSLLSIPLVLLQGGYITEMFMGFITGFFDPVQPSGEVVGAGFSSIFRNNPAIMTSHFGALDISSPVQLVVALLELGPVIWFVPWLAIRTIKQVKNRAEDWIQVVFIFGALIGLIVPTFIDIYGRDITRLTGYGISVFGYLLVLSIFDNGINKNLRSLITVCLILMVFGGVVVTGSLISSAGALEYGDNIFSIDASISSQLWGEYPVDTIIYDSEIAWRPVALFGSLADSRPIKEAYSLVSSDNKGEELAANEIASLGFDLVFFSGYWWNKTSETIQESFNQPCVLLVAEVGDKDIGYSRTLFDVSACRKEN